MTAENDMGTSPERGKPRYASRTLADYISTVNPESLTQSARDKVVSCLLDIITATVAGYDTSSAAAVRRVAREMFGPGAAAIWFGDETLSSAGAAFCNAAAASALDLDDGHRSARGHPGAAVIPAALAVATDRATPSSDIMTAIALGYEVGVRIAAAQNPGAIKSRQSGRWAGYAAVAAAGKLSGIGASDLSHALAIAGVLAPNQDANGSSGYSKLTGNDVKEGIPWAVLTGMTALSLSRSGHTGPEDILDHASHYDTASILRDLVEPRKIKGTYFKPYACCRYVHPAIDAFRDLNAQHGLRADDIASIEVQTFAWARKLANRLEPDSLTDIQYSLPYCLAIAVVEGVNALAPISEDLLSRPDLSRFADRVHIAVDAEIDRRFPEETLARVVIVDRQGNRFASSVTTARGDAGRPMHWGEIEEKFLKVTAPKLSRVRQRALLNGFELFKREDPSPLLAVLKERLDQ